MLSLGVFRHAKPQAASKVKPQAGSKVKPQAASKVKPQAGSKAKPQAGSKVKPQAASKAKSQAAAMAIACLVAVARSFGAEVGADRYAQLVLADPALVSYWRFEGDCRDANGSLDGQSRPGPAQFGEGPGGGKAILLEAGRFVTMGNTPDLDLSETTIELWFKPTFERAGYNPCIIAKRADGDHRFTRFSVHLWGDYSCLAIWNGRAVMRFLVGSGPLKRGQWYHLAVTCTPQQVRMFVDGVPCDLDGPHELFNFDQKNLPLSVGSSQPKGAELLECAVDEVAVYRKALSEDAIAAHVDAMGWQARREALLEQRKARIEREKKLRAEQDGERERRRAELMADPALTARGQPTVYRGDRLRAISFTLGGIGTGSIQINGRAERHVWQIFNNHRHAAVPHSFFAVRAKTAGGPPVLRALQTTPVGPFPAMKALSFRGEYPFAWYTFEEPELPVKVSLEALNPLVPLQTRVSAMPCGVFNVSVENPTDKPVEVALLAAQQNAVGYLGDQPIQGRAYPGYRDNVNELARQPGAVLLHMTTRQANDAPGAGDMVLAALAESACGLASWESLDELAATFLRDGRLAQAAPEGPLSHERERVAAERPAEGTSTRAGPSPAGQTLDGALAVPFTLEPRQQRTVRFILTWHFPNTTHGAGGGWNAQGNRYAAWWPDARAVARELIAAPELWYDQTRLFHRTLYASNLPHWLIDRISSQLAVLRSRTCFWGKNGYFGAWEGCGPDAGCCHGNCNHVWHYAQAHARLFPDIARQMRQQEFQHQGPDGAIPHRQFKSFPAFDGQCGAVLNSYREHLMSANRQWLDQHWPSIRKAMDYTIATWDKDEDGVLAGPQWNTLDGALGGSTSWLGTMYLAALAAAEKMAILENDPLCAERYARIGRAGAPKQDETLFNGEYYVQIPDPTPREDYGPGCAIDQLLGQWWAHQLDLGWLYPPDRARTALASLFRYNFRGNLKGLKQVPRQFVAEDDPGTQMITWPKGPRPPKVILYGDEVMTGFEYSAAAAMIQAGLLREGLTVARAVWTRYDGRLREGLTPGATASWGYSGNPFGDDECGKFYARAMSAWSLLLACQGLVYDGPAGTNGFQPVWQPEDHASFFSAAEGWGLFDQRREPGVQTARIEVKYGQLRVSRLVFQVRPGTAPRTLTVRLGQQVLPAKYAEEDGRVRIALDRPVLIAAGETLEVRIATR